MTTRKTAIGKRLNRARKRGVTLIETALVLAIVSLLLVFFVQMSQNENDRLTAKNTADKLNEIAVAADSYLSTNYAALLPLAPTGTGALVIPVARTTSTGAIPTGPSGLNSIQGAGLLNSAFIDVNAYQQHTALLVHKVNASTLEAILTTYGGQAIPDRLLGQASKVLGAKGGFMPKKYVNAADNGSVLGTNGGWRVTAANWGAAATRPDVGSLQANLSFGDNSLLKDYLYRYDTGNPEANRMHTAIDANGNAINNISGLTGVFDSTTGNNTVTATGDTLRAGIDVWADRDLHAGGNANVTGNVTAGGNVSGTNVTASAQLSGNSLAITNNAAIGGTLTVNGNGTFKKDLSVGGNETVTGNDTIAGTLKAGKLDASALVLDSTDTTGRFTTVAGLTLADFLPKQVSQYSYIIGDGNLVYKPTCKGGYANARIYVYKQVDSSQESVNNNVVQIATAIVATDNTSYWTVHWVGDAAATGTARQAVAQTFCFYGP